jgi:hypothetical protein
MFTQNQYSLPEAEQMKSAVDGFFGSLNKMGFRMTDEEIQNEAEEVILQKELITEYASQAESALTCLQELTGFDYSSALRGIAVTQELVGKMQKSMKLISMYEDLAEEF